MLDLPDQIGWPRILKVAAWQSMSRHLLETDSCTVIGSGCPTTVWLNDRYKEMLDIELGFPSDELRTKSEADAEALAIDAYFAKIRHQLVKVDPRAKASADSKATFKAMGRAMGESPCRTCTEFRSRSGADARACSWTKDSELHDLQAQNAGGECLRHLRELFAWAVQASAQAYYQATGQEPFQRIFLSTGHGNTNTSLRCSVDAQTFEVEPVSARRVRLTLAPDELNPSDFATLPYVFFHEVVVHGHCGQNVEAADATESIIFHEGMMDCVAHGVLARQTGEGDGLEKYVQTYRSHTERARNYRKDASRSENDAAAPQWALGGAAYDALVDLFTAAMQAPKGSRRAKKVDVDDVKFHADQFLLRLNCAQDYSHSDRGRLAFALLHKFSRNNPAATAICLLENIEVVEKVSNYLHSGRAIDLALSIADGVDFPRFDA